MSISWSRISSFFVKAEVELPPAPIGKRRTIGEGSENATPQIPSIEDQNIWREQIRSYKKESAISNLRFYKETSAEISKYIRIELSILEIDDFLSGKKMEDILEDRKKSPEIVPSNKYYQFPTLSLLKELSPSDDASDDEYRDNMSNLLSILGESNIAVSPGEIHVGPVIARYEIVLAIDIAIEKIFSLEKKIARGLRVQSVRIHPHTSDSTKVDIEIPNRTPTPVGIRDILESEDWVSTKAEIPIALGKDVSGKPVISDLAQMQHLLIAGATGSGKSVCINSIITSIVYRKSPKDLRLIMVDLEDRGLKVFNSLPHMLIPVITEAEKVSPMLKWLRGEMEQRYQFFAKVGVRDIDDFNHRKKNTSSKCPRDNDNTSTGEQQTLEDVDRFVTDDGIEVPDRIPHIAVIIDEIAVLMVANRIENSIAQLCPLASSAGIYLIITTRCLSRDIINYIIKANFRSRIAFQVVSKNDSCCVLYDEGAEKLIGSGDMLFFTPNSIGLTRAQGAFVSDEEVKDIVEYLKRYGPPRYASSVQRQIDGAAEMFKVILSVFPKLLPHISTLGLRYSQLSREDPYGNIDDSDWNKDLDAFVGKNLNQSPESWTYDPIREFVYLLAKHYSSYQSLEIKGWENLEPHEFEEQCCNRLKQLGWEARTTKGSGDQRIDIIARDQYEKLVIQCKRYKGTVGNAAVQEIIAGKNFERATRAAVISTGKYTKSAQQLASSANVDLLHPTQIDEIFGHGSTISSIASNKHVNQAEVCKFLVQFIDEMQSAYPHPKDDVDFDNDDLDDAEDLGEDSQLYQDVLDVLRSTKRASTSMIQRRLKIGYNRAARVMDLLEQRGIIGPENGSSPREILVDLDSL